MVEPPMTVGLTLLCFFTYSFLSHCTVHMLIRLKKLIVYVLHERRRLLSPDICEADVALRAQTVQHW